ncbi:Crib domain-containing protein ric4 [Thalictrum thalictroides]|uniref:Crib domain-containing protein ric4 n=1 Tax=Thalictrum thalictroides TaxID=46969 RepID=A0A7J6X6K9_THATH|nr:Crib domain-containing protein ric4 [Thalictrum thalictroides]
MERLVLFPFSIGCASQSSVAVVVDNYPKKAKQEPSPSPTREEESSSSGKMKNPIGFLSIPKPNISSGIQKLVKGFKSFSQLFVYKDEVEEMDMDMEIGLPTDVKHVTHIGWDGSTTTNPMMGWDELKAPELLSLPTYSFKQFELAMASQAESPVLGSSKVC